MFMPARNATAFTNSQSSVSTKSRGSLEARIENLLLWFLQLALAVAFLGAGGAKLVDNPEMVTTFDHVGLGQWVRYLTGAVEIAGAAFLLVPRFPAIGMALLLPVLAGAIFAHLVRLQDGGALPSTILFGLLLVVAWRRGKALRAALRSVQSDAAPR